MVMKIFKKTLKVLSTMGKAYWDAYKEAAAMMYNH